MMSNVSIQGGVAYATDVLLAQQVFYKQSFGWGFQMLLVITTQCLGFGMAGIVRRFLIWPSAMIWPQTLANTTLMYTLHDHSPSDPAHSNGWRIGRYKYFLIVFSASFVWYWFPGWIAQGLTYFAWICWIAPNNMVVNQVFGNSSGFGLVRCEFSSNFCRADRHIDSDYLRLDYYHCICWQSASLPILCHREHDDWSSRFLLVSRSWPEVHWRLVSGLSSNC